MAVKPPNASKDLTAGIDFDLSGRKIPKRVNTNTAGKVAGANTDGKGNAMGAAGYANIALGVSSLIKGATNKKPRGYKATPYVANVRPAQGNEESLKRTKNDISEQVSSASRDVTKIAGSDANAGILARLGIQSNASKAIASAEADNAKLVQQDQARVSQELNQQSMVNTQISNNADQVNAQVDQANYAANQQASAAGIQSALQYENNREADNKNKFAQQESANQMIDVMGDAHWQDTYNEAIRASKGVNEAVAIADAAKKARSMEKYKSRFYSGTSTIGRARK